MASAERKRLDELLLARATEGLDAAEEQELARLLTMERDVDAGAYERAAAAVCLAVLGGRGELPAALRARLERGARDLASRPKEQ
jgi:hypothetical protein